MEREDADRVEVGSATGCDVGPAGLVEGAAHDVAQPGEDGRGVTGAQLVCVTCEGDVADPVHAVLDRPVPAGPFGQFAGGGLLPGQVGDGVDGLGRLPPRAQGTAAPGDPQHLAGVRERQVVDGDGLQLAVLLTAVADVVAAVHHRDLVPGQGSQLFR